MADSADKPLEPPPPTTPTSAAAAYHLHPRREPFEHGLLPIPKLIFTDGAQALSQLKSALLSSDSDHRVNLDTLARVLQIPIEQSRLIIETISSVLHDESDPLLKAGVSKEIDSIGVNVFDLLIFLYIQSYKRLLPKGHRDSAAVADVWPSTSAFDGFLSALSPLQLVRSNNRRFIPSQADEEAHQLSYLQKHIGNILSLLADSTEGEGDDSLVLSMDKFEHLGFLMYFGEKGIAKIPLSQSTPFFANSDPDMPAAPVPASQVLDWLLQSISSTQEHISDRVSPKENGPSSSDQDVQMADVGTTSLKPSISPRGPSFIEGVSKSSCVKQASDLKGTTVKVVNCHESVIYILAPLRYATVYGCSDATIVIGAVGKAIRVEHCERVHLITAARRICIANCRECVFFLGVNQQPLVVGDNHKLQVAPYNTFYSQLGEGRRQIFDVLFLALPIKIHTFLYFSSSLSHSLSCLSLTYYNCQEGIIYIRSANTYALVFVYLSVASHTATRSLFFCPFPPSCKIRPPLFLMDSSGFSSPRTDCFPAGLRVLVVDDDPTWLKILEKMLKKCNYEVTTCNLAREALDLLRERKDGFDIVISDVNMPDMDGFKLLEHVGLEMDLPVIMMSVDGETSRVMKGVQHGACDYLLKPIRMKELRNIWQHVFRKRIHEVRDIEGHESLDEMMLRGGADLSDDGFFFGGDPVSGKKRKDVDYKGDDRVGGDPSSLKKARVVWTVDLHQKFVKAVNLIGFEKVGPKKILDLMGVPWLTRENVASHLQKYRLYLSRLQKENELRATLGGAKLSDSSPKDAAAGGNAGLQTPVTKASPCLKHDDPKSCEGNVKSMPIAEAKAAAEVNDLAKSSTSSISFEQSFGQLSSDAKSEPNIQVQYSWSAGAPPLPFKHEQKPPAAFKHEPKPPLQFKKEQPLFIAEHHRFDHVPVAVAVQSKPSDTPSPAATSKRSQHSEKATKVESTAALFCLQPESHLADSHTTIWNTKSSNHSLEQSLYDESWHRNALVGTGSPLMSDYSSQSDLYPPNPYLGPIDPFSFNGQELFTDVHSHLYDSLKFNPEFPIDPVEYPVIDQGVYIA